MLVNPLACVLGDMDLVRPLGIAGINCAVAVQPGAPPRFSRYTRAVIDWASPWEDADTLVRNLIAFGKTQSEAPVLFYESDGELLLVSRYRKQLGEFFRFVIPDQRLVEELVDKERFQLLANRLALPVPAARRLHTEDGVDVKNLDLRYPVIIKPLTRRPEYWRALAPEGKALRIEGAAELTRLWPKLAASGIEVLAQELIEGPETRIESYHVYVDDQGEIVGEFTGRKIRTFPIEYGESTALVTTNAPDVLSLGRELVDWIGLRGVAKFDFKRAANGKLFLLEINPRFNLWHHLGALAGVNLPALVFADLTDQPRMRKGVARAGLEWCRVWHDIQAAKALQIPLRTWLAWALRCDAKRLLAWDDPKPFLFAGLWRLRQAIRSRISRNASHPATSNMFPQVDKSMNPIRVLMVTSEWPKPGVNVTSHFIKRQADFLSAAGIDVTVFPFRGRKNPFYYLKSWARLQTKLRHERYDLIHAQFGQSGLLALPKRLPLVVTFRGSDLLGTVSDKTRRHLKVGALHQFLSRQVATHSDAVIVVAEHMKAELPSSIESHVIPSGLDLQLFRPTERRIARIRLGLPEDGRLVLFVGRTNHGRKRGYLAEQAMEILNKSLPARLVVAWAIPHTDVPLYMSACDVLLFTSMQEGSPNVVKEALACNLPIVSVAVGDVESRLKGVEGCALCADDDPETIAAALHRILLRGGRTNGRATVLGLDENITTHKVIDIYQAVLACGKAAGAPRA